MARVLTRRAAENAEEYAYSYDPIGNRQSSADLGESRTYTANNLNQYTGISTGGDAFAPQFDDDGQQKSAKPKPKAQGDRDFEATPQEWSEERYSATQRQLYQTLIETKTGVWSVTYNGENRPIMWECGSTNITMSFDRMGRRVEYTETVGTVTNAHRTFVYDNYLQIADNSGNRYLWDPTEPVATRPLVWIHNADTYSYTHDGNKNVSEVVDANGAVTAHYEYAPFGDVTVTVGSLASANRFRFSSEYADDTLGLVYYNYRHYEPVTGRWMSKEPLNAQIIQFLKHVIPKKIEEDSFITNNPYSFVQNDTISYFDVAGLMEKSLVYISKQPWEWDFNRIDGKIAEEAAALIKRNEIRTKDPDDFKPNVLRNRLVAILSSINNV